MPYSAPSYNLFDLSNRLSHLGLTTEGLREVEQRDIQVRLQELFRDRKLELENTLKNMETHYERILKASHKILWQLYLDKAV